MEGLLKLHYGRFTVVTAHPGFGTLDQSMPASRLSLCERSVLSWSEKRLRFIKPSIAASVMHTPWHLHEKFAQLHRFFRMLHFEDCGLPNNGSLMIRLNRHLDTPESHPGCSKTR